MSARGAPRLELDPFEVILERSQGLRPPLPREISRIYGSFSLEPPRGRPWVLANLASTLDGVARLSSMGPARAGEVADGDPHDRFLLGLLRSLADYVVVGAGTLRSAPNHSWLPGATFAPASELFETLRRRWGRPEPPVRVFVSAEGHFDLSWPVFRSGVGRCLLVSGPRGARRLQARGLPPGVSVLPLDLSTGSVSAEELVRRLPPLSGNPVVLLEGGPRLLGTFLSEQALDELFLTLALRVAGRGDRNPRTSLVEGRAFSPDRTPWGTLISVRGYGSNLFLRLGIRSRPSTR